MSLLISPTLPYPWDVEEPGDEWIGIPSLSAAANPHPITLRASLSPTEGMFRYVDG